jgi:hypothetical protein
MFVTVVVTVLVFVTVVVTVLVVGKLEEPVESWFCAVVGWSFGFYSDLGG